MLSVLFRFLVWVFAKSGPMCSVGVEVRERKEVR